MDAPAILTITERRVPLSTGRSINEVGCRLHSFGINDLEVVDLTGIEPVTS